MQRVVAGIDLGSGRSKAVLLDEGGAVLGRAWRKTSPGFTAAAEDMLAELLKPLGLGREQVAYVATTGLGRYAVEFRDIQITELTCGAKGAWSLFPGTRSVIDIGNQSTRAIKSSSSGKVRDFKSNEKCAAGSGGFLEKAAKYLEVPIEKMGTLSLCSSDPRKISSICAVLAESEIISQVSDGHKVEDIVRGVYDSLADRAVTLLRRVGLEGELTFIGGVARQEGMISALQERAGTKINVPEEPDYVCALGAGLLGLERLRKREALAPGVASA
ncbi:MAG: 2-hydroxyglutaryl-CoA dehydratase [Elusimicrobia bacterium]|nr:2-hydroxyglutaryl-CoA dehydratase [Elusimicrobiota bacterium]